MLCRIERKPGARKSILSTVICSVIRKYQRFVSPFLGVQCRFFPSCSEYATEAVERFGIFRGVLKILARLFRCHPLHAGGYDPVSK